MEGGRKGGREEVRLHRKRWSRRGKERREGGREEEEERKGYMALFKT